MKTTVGNPEVFANELKEALMKQLDPNLYSIFIDKMPKRNQVKTGICVRKGNFGAVFYAEDILRDLEENPRPVEMVAREIAQSAIQIPTFNRQEIEDFMEWGNVQDKIELRLVNSDRNKMLLASSPHREFFDLSLIYYITVKETAAARVDNNMFQHWGVTEEDLFIAGCKAMRKKHPVEVKSLAAVLQGIDPCFEVEPPENAVPLYLLGSSSGSFLSSAVLYSNAVEELAIKCQTDIYILPSSVHELLLVPASSETDEAFLLQTVWTINRTQVAEADFLSDNIYLYRHESGKFDIIRQPE